MVLDAERPAGAVELDDPVLAELIGEQMAQIGRDDLPKLAQRAGHERDPGPLGGVHGHRRPGPDRLVIRVRVHQQQASVNHQTIMPRDPTWHDARTMTESFPRQQARTRGFRLGVPRAFQVSADGDRVTFLRSRAGDDPVTCLWEADTVTGAERLVADPRALGADEENLPPEERARRERVRETAAGIVAYATDRAGALAVFALSGQVYAVPLGEAEPTPRLVATQTPALDPRPDSTGTKVAYVHDGALRVVDLVSGHDSVIAEAAGEDAVTFGLAEFVAAEEMGRSRGYWWSPDGSQLLIARVDESPVRRWYIADPANPDKAPAQVRYPAAGTPNADVSLLLATIAKEAGDGTTAKLEEVEWDRAAFPYLTAVAWGETPLMVVYVPRSEGHAADQRRHRRADPRGRRPGLDRRHRRPARPARQRGHRLDRRSATTPAG